MTLTLLLLLSVVLLSCILTYLLRGYGLKQLMDIPNARSSHTTPTPRGGGVAFVLAFLLCLPFLYLQSFITHFELWGLLGAGVLVATIGFFDDKGHIPARWRLLAHFLAASWILYWFDGFPPITFWGITLSPYITSVLALLFLVWLLNLFNFMDGIDGLASLEAITVCLFITILYPYDDSFPPLFLAAAVVGFLIWNFPPAKIFMGDAGSGFLGIILGAFAINSAHISLSFFIAWLILLGVFIVDTTWTLIHRLLRKERVYEAHRTHAYQFASRRLGQHLPVTLGILAINVLWLFPIAWLTMNDYITPYLALLIAYLPLLGLAFYFKAGSAE